MGSRTSSAQQVNYVGNTDVFCFGFYFMSPNWTKTIIVIEITLLLHAYSCLPLVQVGYRFLRISPEGLIEISPLLIVHGNAMNTNDVMCASHDMHAPVSQPSLSIHDVPEITYWHAIHAAE